MLELREPFTLREPTEGFTAEALGRSGYTLDTTKEAFTLTELEEGRFLIHEFRRPFTPKQRPCELKEDSACWSSGRLSL